MADNDFAEFKSALIVGAGAGLSAALARVLTRAGLKVTLASRTIDDLTALQRDQGGRGGQPVREPRAQRRGARRGRL